MDQQQEQRERKGGVRERREELQKERKQSWWWVGGGSREPGRSDWDERAAQINSSVVCILPVPLRGLHWRSPPERVAKLKALPLKGKCQLPKMKGGLRLPEQRHPDALCMPRRRRGSSASVKRSHGARWISCISWRVAISRTERTKDREAVTGS